MLRTWMFIPGNEDKHLQKVQELSADVFIFDLEDAVATNDKKQARRKVKECMQTVKDKTHVVRVNALSTPYFLEDVREVVQSELTGIMIPMLDERDDVIIADYLLEQLEIQHGLEKNSISIIPLIETAKGLHHSYDIAAASERVSCLAFGVEDFILDTHIDCSEDEQELLYARSKLVEASRAAGIAGPVDSIYADFTDDVGLTRSTTQGKRLGFQGKLVIHPNQIDVVNHVFAPTSEQMETARKIVEKYDQKGEGVIQVDGKMVDDPVVEQARRVLSEAKK